MRMLLAAALVAAAVPTPVASQAVTPAATVHIRNDAFVPATITIKSGQSVTFINDDDDAHTVTADDASWDSEGLNQGQKWTHAFTTAGKIVYHCTVHPFMHGAIVVTKAS